jgi:branched-chain amino acid transport system ATP-binding protein
MLSLEHVDAYYGSIPVLHDLSLHVGPGEIVGLLGHNGMGKTTTLKSILQLAEVKRGHVIFDGRDITHWSAHRVPRLGIGYLPQGQRVFPEMTVRENLLIAPTISRDMPAEMAKVLTRFPQLKDRLDQLAGTLSGGEQQMLALARLLLMRPKLALLDEPTEGLMPRLVSQAAQVIRELKGAGVGVLLAEQRIATALQLCDRIYLVEKGRIVLEKEPTELTETDLHWHLGVGIN